MSEYCPQSNKNQWIAFEDAQHFIQSMNPTEPVYLFCEQALRVQSRHFQSNFPGLTSYAVKANPNPDILKALYASGIHAFDVASLEEVRSLRGLFPNADLHFNNPIKSQDAIGAAYHDHNVRSFVVDDLCELNKIHQIIGEDNSVEISVRFKLKIDLAVYDFTSKFGASNHDAITLLQAVRSMGYRPSLTFHPGSQCEDPTAYADYIKAAGEISRSSQVDIYRLNVGGGFPAKYCNQNLNNLNAFFGLIEKHFSAQFSHADTLLLCEPGRSMVASCCSLLNRVIHRRNDNTLFLNDGVYGGLMEQMMVDIQLPLQVWRQAELLNDQEQVFQIFGPTCDAIDKLPSMPLPFSIAEGDYIEFGYMGAYASSTTTAFNGFRSADYFRVKKNTIFVTTERAA